nr:hypothetical protein [Tanacetum cinerariifolium]
NTKAYKEYYACATGEAAPKPKASARRKRGGFTSSTTLPTPIATPTPITTVVAAPRLSAAAKGRRRIFLSKVSTDEETGSKPGVLDVPSDDSDDEISWNSSDDEDVDAQEETREKEEESFDPIPRTPKDSEDDGNGEEDQVLRISKEERMHEEEEADELYRDVDINQGRGLQVSQDIDDSHVTLTPIHSDG